MGHIIYLKLKRIEIIQSALLGYNVIKVEIDHTKRKKSQNIQKLNDTMLNNPSVK